MNGKRMAGVDFDWKLRDSSDLERPILCGYPLLPGPHQDPARKKAGRLREEFVTPPGEGANDGTRDWVAELVQDHAPEPPSLAKQEPDWAAIVLLQLLNEGAAIHLQGDVIRGSGKEDGAF